MYRISSDTDNAWRRVILNSHFVLKAVLCVGLVRLSPRFRKQPCGNEWRYAPGCLNRNDSKVSAFLWYKNYANIRKGSRKRRRQPTVGWSKEASCQCLRALYLQKIYKLLWNDLSRCRTIPAKFTLVSNEFYNQCWSPTATSALKFQHLGHMTSSVTWQLDQQFMVS